MRLPRFAPFVALLAALPASSQPAPSVDALMEAGHWKRVRAAAEARLQSDPKDAQAHVWLSKAKASFGDLEGALAEAERAVALDSRSANAHAQLAEVYAILADKSSVVKGVLYLRHMKKEIASTLAIEPKHIDTLLIQMVFAWKAPAFAGGDKRQALEIADRLVTISPVWGYLAHARLLQDQSDDATKEGWLKKAIAADPSLYRARVLLARLYCCAARSKRPDLAERAALDAVNLDPSASGAYEVLARLYASQQRWSDLENLLARAEKAVPDDLSAYLEAARALLDIGQDFRRAERYISKYMSQPPEGRQPTQADARVLLATLYEREGRKAEAKRLLHG